MTGFGPTFGWPSEEQLKKWLAEHPEYDKKNKAPTDKTPKPDNKQK